MSRYGPYADVIDRLEYWQQNADDIVIEEAIKEEDELVRMNTDDQLLQGIDSNNNPIEPPYSPFTVQIKRLKGQPTDRVTLHDTGDFHKGFHVERSGRNIYLDSKDSKTEKLVNKYGEEIFGINPENLDEFSDVFLKPRLQERFTKTILG